MKMQYKIVSQTANKVLILNVTYHPSCGFVPFWVARKDLHKYLNI